MIESTKRLFFILQIDQIKLDVIFKDIDKYYYKKLEPKTNYCGKIIKNNGFIKYRILYPSKGDLEVIQTRIYKRILSKIKLPSNVHGGIKKRSNLTNSIPHIGQKFHFVTDLRSYFPSISSKRVYKVFLDFGFSHDVSYILTKLTTYKGFLPQGIPTSPMLSNLIFAKTDKEINKFCIKNKIIYTRYIDDLTFSASYDIKLKIPIILSILKRNKFVINNEKTFFKKGKIKVTGTVVHNNRLSPQSKHIRKLHFLHGNFTRENGMLNYFKQIEEANKK